MKQYILIMDIVWRLGGGIMSRILAYNAIRVILEIMLYCHHAMCTLSHRMKPCFPEDFILTFQFQLILLMMITRLQHDQV